MKALLHNYRQSPRKVRLVADMIRGKRVLVAMDALSFLPKKSAPDMKKLLASAVANAQQMGARPENLFVKTITVDKGSVLRRFMPMARGRAGGIRKTMSIVKIELGMLPGTQLEAKTETVEAAPAAKTAKKTAKKAAKKKTAATK